ncbi:hypothetical protein BDV95DRAFT_611683 [Massariosphaeria phaeospora]|uniref:Hsp70 protein-domain-containing protein n=1 Tax=Massariosphaeria phaeospora TaxID=100035 RepID=A0A7C8I2U1_9PLEO|nr:hypothetical protein BDV95DRAFT_611683 [Massariosphaeria phaeospora]
MATSSSRIGARLLFGIVLLFPLTYANDNAQFPYALTFGSSTLTASWFTKSEGIKAIQFPVDSKYRAYFEDALASFGKRIMRRGEWHVMAGDELVPAPPDTHNEDTAVSLFRDAAQQVSRNLSATLGFEPTYAALTLSSVFNQSSTKAATDAIFPNGMGFIHSIKSLNKVAPAACVAHRLDLCGNLGRTPAECADKDSISNLILVLEYEKEYLYVDLVFVYSEYRTFPSVGHEMLREFGEANREKLLKSMSTYDYNRKLHQTLNAFIESLVERQLIVRVDIRAIVVAGGASATAIAQLRKLAHNAVGNGVVKVVDEIDPGLATAHGAAANNGENDEEIERAAEDENIDDDPQSGDPKETCNNDAIEYIFDEQQPQTFDGDKMKEMYYDKDAWVSGFNSLMMECTKLYIFADKYSIPQLRDDITSALVGHSHGWGWWPDPDIDIIELVYNNLPSSSGLIRLLVLFTAYSWSSSPNVIAWKDRFRGFHPEYLLDVLFAQAQLLENEIHGEGGIPYDGMLNSCVVHEHLELGEEECRERLAKHSYIFASLLSACQAANA